MFVFYIVHPQIDGGIFISESYDDWDNCYEVYCDVMLEYKAQGIVLEDAICRGVREQGA